MLPAVVSDLRKSTNIPPEHFNVRPTLDDVKAFAATEFAADIECTIPENRITMVGLSDRMYHAICVPFEGVYINELERIFANAKRVIGHNIVSFDQPHLEAAGIAFSKDCEIFDTILGQHLLQPDLPHGLDFLGSFFTGAPAWKHLPDEGGDEALYCCRDVSITYQCAQQIEPLLKYEKLWSFYQNVSLPLAKICRLMTETGFRVDPSRLKKVRAELEVEAKNLESELPEKLRTHEVPVRKRQLAPPGTLSPKTGKPLKYVMVEATEEETPWKSTQVLQEYLYNEKGLPTQTHVKTGQLTVDKTALPKLIKYADDETRRALRALNRLRAIASLVSTFVKDEWGGIERIHSRFNPFGTASGRLASNSPNIQNWPISARYICVPSYSDWVLVSSDFSSLENRLTALFSNDTERLERLARPGFCLAPETRVLRSDLTWVPIGSLKPDDELIAFPENAKGHERKMQRTKVVSLLELEAPAFRVNTTRGSVVASANHRWLSQAGKGTVFSWIETCKLKPGRNIGFLTEPWEVDDTREGGYLAGFLGGEGNLNRATCGVTFSQNPGVEADYVDSLFVKRGFRVHRTPCKNEYGSWELHYIGGGEFSAMRLIGALRPVRLLQRHSQCWEGLSLITKKRAPAVVLSIEPLPSQKLISLETVHKTFIAEGFLSHNSEHKHNASILFGIPYDLVEKDSAGDSPYTKAKKVTHGLNYGEGPMKIAKTNDLPFAEVKALVEKWKAANPKTIQWQGETAARAKADGFLVTPFGRKRWFWGSNVHTESLSFLPQSSGADILIRCMIALMWKRIGWPEEKVQRLVGVYHALPLPARLLVTVHDSFVIETPLSLLDEVKAVLDEVLTQPWQEFGGYRFPIETGSGPSWGECH